MPKLTKTTFQDELTFRYDLLGGELLTTITRELSKKRKLLPNISSDQQNMASLWRGLGVEGDPYYWVKVNAANISAFTGFFAGAENWGKFRHDVFDALLDALNGIDADFVESLTATYSWVVPTSELGSLKELITFSHLVVPEDLEQPERFSTLLLNPTTKQRVLFEGSPDGMPPNETRLNLSVQTNRIDSSLAKVFEGHFSSTDAAYVKANSFIESVFAR